MNKLGYILFLFTFYPVCGQNLVPNASFETVGQPKCNWSTNPSDFTDVISAWRSPSVTTPDIHSYLVNSDCWSYAYPNSHTGFGCKAGEQRPRSGNVMVGITTRGSDGVNWMEYVHTNLLGALVPGRYYKVTFYISLAEFSAFASNNHGVFFSNNAISSSEQVLNLDPQVEFKKVTRNDKAWIRRSAIFLATSDWSYITIGNFNNVSSTSYSPHSGCRTASYYFIDDVSVTPDPMVALGDSIICPGESTFLNVINENNPRWALEQDPGSIIHTGSNLAVTPDSTTTYIIYGSEDTARIKVQVKPLADLDLGPDTTLCEGESIRLDAQFPGATYRWQDGSVNSNYDATEAGLYWVTSTLNECESHDTVNVEFIQYAQIPPESDTTLCEDETILIDVTTEGADYLWDDLSELPTRTIFEEGQYQVVISIQHCNSAHEFDIEYEECDVFLEMPNAFSPNGDGQNDAFVPIKISGIASAIENIHNRYGQKIFTTNDLRLGWDGKCNSSPCPAGTYYWHIRYTDINGDAGELNGYLHLIH